MPYIGVAVGTLPPLLVAFAFDPGWTSFLLTLGVFVVAESITGQVIEPIVYGHSSGLSPTAVVIAASVWAFLWGPIGLVLSTPLTTCLVVLGRHAPGMEFLETLLGNEPPLTAHETFYQRMLAGDPREAASQARSYLKRGAIADYYDEVALEALRRAHVDVGRGDLDEARLNALTQSTTQLVAWLGAAGEKGDRRALLQRFLRLIRRAGPKAALAEREALQDELLRSRRGVAVLYGDHPLDSIAAAMLTHALSRRGLPSRSVSKEEANVATVEQCASVGLVCLCYIEPLTVAHLRGRGGRGAAAVSAGQGDDLRVARPQRRQVQGMERRLRADAIATGIGGAASRGAAAARRMRCLGRGRAVASRHCRGFARSGRALRRCGGLGVGHQLDQRVDRLEARRRRLDQPRHFDHRPDQRLDLRGAAGLDVLQHRCLVGADRFGAGDALLDGDAEFHAERLADGAHLRHHLGDQRPRGRKLTHAVEPRPRQCADGVQASRCPRASSRFPNGCRRRRAP